nr:MAG: Protein of unknown function (DUF2577) [Bacteriophage sp.]UWG11962.1 MAG: Protein of unknown function (DUF2577) [Bacteriophage sp.]UWG21595.1 MAG: Protein of unknown function (DUF2577) [Bacteriophage sp.]
MILVSSGNLVQLIKKIAMDAVRAAKMCDYVTGVVTSEDPLKVKITNSFEIGEEFLMVPQSMTDHEVEVTIKKEYGWKTKNRSGGTGDDIVLENVKIMIHNALKAGDEVLMMRKSGGQEFVVIDKVVKE